MTNTESCQAVKVTWTVNGVSTVRWERRDTLLGNRNFTFETCERDWNDRVITVGAVPLSEVGRILDSVL